MIPTGTRYRHPDTSKQRAEQILKSLRHFRQFFGTFLSHLKVRGIVTSVNTLYIFFVSLQPRKNNNNKKSDRKITKKFNKQSLIIFRSAAFKMFERKKSFCVFKFKFFSLARWLRDWHEEKWKIWLKEIFLKHPRSRIKTGLWQKGKNYNENVILSPCHSHCGAGKVPERNKLFEREKSIGRNDWLLTDMTWN